MRETIKKSVIGGLTFFITVGTCVVVYGALTNLPAKVSPGTGLTANSWNMMVDSLTELDGKINSNSVPSGAILMFNNGCPDTTNWTRVTALDNKFPRGATTYGTTGGADTHTHAATGLLGPSHTHTMVHKHEMPFGISTNAGYSFRGPSSVEPFGVGSSFTSVRWNYYGDASQNITDNYVLTNNPYGSPSTGADGNDPITGNTASSSNVPAYVTVVYCSKN
ncbi:hypothetical protein M0P65_02010 [Candidatus Gracilibacteria bacterium]|nr:hypothetical protein [Candidatus Gracilibacteria bacterium]